MGGKERRDRAIRIVRAVSKGSILFLLQDKDNNELGKCLRIIIVKFSGKGSQCRIGVDAENCS